MTLRASTVVLLLLATTPLRAPGQEGGVPPSPAGSCGPPLAWSGVRGGLDRRLAEIRREVPRVGYPRSWMGDCDDVRPAVLGELMLGVGIEEGRLRYSWGLPPDAPPIPLPDASGLRGAARLAVHLGGEGSALSPHGSFRGVTLQGEVDARDHEFPLRELALVTAGGPLYLWGGLRAPAWGAGMGGGLIFSGEVPLLGVGAGLRGPRPLPWVLARVGNWDFEALVARAGGHPERGQPWMLGGRWTLSPHPALTLDLTRGAMFGGEGVPGLTAGRLFTILAGGHRSEGGEPVQVENQLASLGATLRVPVHGVPVLFLAELGMEDTSGAWARSPALQVGVEVAHPVEPVRVGVQWTWIAPENNHGVWYRHTLYRAGWSDRGRGLGHPLAGPGSEWLVHGGAAGAGGRLQVEGGLALRHRHPDQSSLAPPLQGRSAGGWLDLEVGRGPLRLAARVDGERTGGGATRLEGSLGGVWILRSAGPGQGRP